MSIILSIDSSTEIASVSISNNGSVLQHLTNTVQKDHAAFLHVSIQKILKALHLKPSEIDAIAVTAGPGSFTGLRVGFAAAKGLSFALNKPLISISSLEMMAKAVVLTNKVKSSEWLCPMIDARRAEVYTGLYSRAMEVIQSPHALILNENSFAAQLGENNLFFFGSGASKFQQIFSGKNAHFTTLPETFSALSDIAFSKFECHDFVSAMSAAPLYVKEFYNG